MDCSVGDFLVLHCFLEIAQTHDHWVSAAAAKSLQSCPTLCNPIDGSPPGPPSLGFSRQEHRSGSPFPSPVHACTLSCFSHFWLWATLWTAAHQAPPFTDSLDENTGVVCQGCFSTSYPLLHHSPPVLHLSWDQGLFPMSWHYASVTQSIGASASASDVWEWICDLNWNCNMGK